MNVKYSASSKKKKKAPLFQYAKSKAFNPMSLGIS